MNSCDLPEVEPLSLLDPDPLKRAATYRDLGAIDADIRPGIGLRADGLPDITWCEVSIGDFIYGYHEIRTLPTFYIAKYPITYKQFSVFVEAYDGFKNIKWWDGFHPDGLRQQPGGPKSQKFKYWNHPRDRVSWYDAVAYCRWLSAHYTATNNRDQRVEIRLPIEEEWEKAARGTDGREYPDSHTSELVKALTREGYNRLTTAVGIFPDATSPYGVMDMCTNVREWTFSNIKPYYKCDPSTAERRVLRGGLGSSTNSRGDCHPASRNQFMSVGFRVVYSETNLLL